MRLTTSPPSCAECHEIWEPKPPGTLWATPDLLRDSFTRNIENCCSSKAIDFYSRVSQFDSSELAFLSLFVACRSDSGTHF